MAQNLFAKRFPAIKKTVTSKKMVGFEKTIDIHNATQWKNRLRTLSFYGYKRQKGTRTWILEGEGFRYVIHLMKIY